MFARVTRWEGGETEAMRESVAEIGQRASSGPPEGVPSNGFLLLVDPAGGRTLAIALFPDEASLREGDATLNEMSPPGDGLGQRAAVERYEVAVDIRLDR